MKKITIALMLIFSMLLEISSVAFAQKNEIYISAAAVDNGEFVAVDVSLSGNEIKGVVYVALMQGEAIINVMFKQADEELRFVFDNGLHGNKIRVFLWESIVSMKPLCDAIDVDIDAALVTVASFKQPGEHGTVGQILAEDNYLYLARQGIVYKIDVSDVNSPQIVARGDYSNDEESIKVATAMQINGDYIYVGSRRLKAGFPTEEEEANLKAGELAVLKKSDLSTVKIIPLGKKVSGISLCGNILALNLQVLGWSIYDVKNPAQPVLLEEINFYRGESREVQGGELFERNNKLYYAAGGFGDGIRLYDLTEFAEYVEDPSAFEAVPEIKNNELVWYYSFYRNGLGGNHTYDLVVDYPYIYATIAASKGSEDNEDRIQGVLTLDITDVEKKPSGHRLSLIADEDKNDLLTGSDTQPTVIHKIGNWLVLNNENKGVAYFDIAQNTAQPVYKGSYKPTESCFIYRMATDEKGRLFLADSRDTASTPQIYIVEGWK